VNVLNHEISAENSTEQERFAEAAEIKKKKPNFGIQPEETKRNET
jgi:hypothetical protein